MQSLSIDFIFNRVYDVLLWIKYVFLFVILRTNEDTYLDAHKDRVWDGLRDRDWIHHSVPVTDNLIAGVNMHETLFQRIAHKFGYNLPDSDHDGIPDISDPSPYDVNNLSTAQLKERFQNDFNWSDKLRDIFGIGPKDSDGDGVPDSYEIAHGMNPRDGDTDHDGFTDGQELILGTDPLNNDTDGDNVLDARDEAPLDGHVSSIGFDSDGDGVSDKIENLLHTDIHNRDTDGDGLPDGMDPYPLDAHNISNYLPINLPDIGLHLSIQNPFLSFVSDFLSVLFIFLLVIFAYVIFRWLLENFKAAHHFEHHFKHDKKHKAKEEKIIAGVPHLPTAEEFVLHPRWAIIEGYMASDQEMLWRIGILEADNMLHDVLRERGTAGEDLGEMLTNSTFKTVQLAWDAHKIRNRIAHEGVQFTLTDREAKRAYVLYESVFREFKLVE